MRRGRQRVIFCIFAILLVPAACLAALTDSQRQLDFSKVLLEIMSSATPDITEQERRTIIARYVDSRQHRAIAVQDVYRRYFLSEGHEDGESASERTLEGCQLRFAKTCAIIAVDDDPSSDVLVSKDMPRLDYSGEFDLSKIPIVSAKIRARKDIQAYFAAPEPKALAIHPLGYLFSSYGEQSSKAAQVDALGRCNDDTVRASAEGPCFIYAIGNEVVLPTRLKQPR
jgi:hypothetical protein